jgi:tetratricopeptide (TPR) repeat protein
LTAGPGQQRTAQYWLALAILVIVPLLALGRVCRDDFTSWDDSFTLRDNPTMNPVTWDSVQRWWAAPFMDLYVPLTYTVWGGIAVFARVPETPTVPAHLNPMPFHAANLVLHVFAVLVVFHLLRILIGKTWPSAAGALLFGLHPIQVEAVAWASGFKDVLAGLLALLSIWQYLLAVRESQANPPRPRWRWRYVVAMLFYLLAMLTKPGAIVVPLIAWILDAMVLGRSWKTAGRWLWPWFVLAAGGAVETFIFQGAHVDPNNVAIYLRPLLALDSLAFYLGKLFWPTHLGIDYGLRPPVMIHEPWLVMKCLAIAGLGVLLLWRLGRRARPVGAAAVLLVVPLLPTLGLVTFDFQSYSNVADHYLYLSMFGAAMLVAWACRRWNRWPTYAVAAGGLAMLGWASNVQAHYWKDSPTLLRHEMSVNSESPTIYSFMAREYLNQRDYSSAIAFAQHALRLDPTDPKAHITLGQALWHENEKTEAMKQFRAGLKVTPDDTDALEGLAQAMVQLGRFDDAESLIKRELAVDPRSPEGHFDLGAILYHEQKLPEAISELRQAVDLVPDRPQFRIVLAKALEAAGQDQAALAEFQAAAKLAPNSAEAAAGIRRLGAGK